MNRLWFENGGLDQIDAELLATLATDGRITIADLARKVGMSPPSVAERIKRLEEAQVILGYSARINPAALGLPLAVHIRVRPMPGPARQTRSIAQQAAGHCRVRSHHRRRLLRREGACRERPGVGEADRPDHSSGNDQYRNHSVLAGRTTFATYSKDHLTLAGYPVSFLVGQASTPSSGIGTFATWRDVGTETRSGRRLVPAD
jgi:DNA-binding Lrp family transcriptional regulator